MLSAGSSKPRYDPENKSHGFAFKVPGPPAYVKMLASTVLSRSSQGAMTEYHRMIDEKVASLWCIVGCGFCLFSVRYFGSIHVRELVFHAAEGNGMVHWKRMFLLFDLCRAEKCDGIFVHTDNQRIQRWLKRWGFMELDNHNNFRWVHGRQRDINWKPIPELVVPFEGTRIVKFDPASVEGS